MFEIDINNQQTCVPVNVQELRQALLVALNLEAVESAVLSVSIVDNETIHRINREHLQHDYPTDVISFQLDFSFSSSDDIEVSHDAEGADTDTEEFPDTQADWLPADEITDDDPRPAAGAAIEGEIIASAEMAHQMAAEGAWSPGSELLLYVIHGLLHICGYDDLSAADKAVMRSREKLILEALGLNPVYPQDDAI